jgi:pSer/pThr/pTyr-binding forkhead associated (FHA) protein
VLTIEDVGSGNGTWVGDVRIRPREWVRILPGEMIAIGHTVLMVLPNDRIPEHRQIWSEVLREAPHENAAKVRGRAAEGTSLRSTS